MARSASQLTHYLLAEAIDLALAGERHEGNLARLAGLEAHGGAGGDVGAVPTCRRAVELQGAVGLGEVIVGADLDRPVAGIGHGDRDGRAAGIDLDCAWG